MNYELWKNLLKKYNNNELTIHNKILYINKNEYNIHR